jgi:hypothetical protein
MHLVNIEIFTCMNEISWQSKWSCSKHSKEITSDQDMNRSIELVMIALQNYAKHVHCKLYVVRVVKVSLAM